MLSRRSFIIAAFLLATASPASAQLPEQTPAAQAALVRGAFDSSYGKALTTELGKALRKDADAACLTAKGLEIGQLEGRGRDVLIKWGTHLMEVTTSLIDPKAYAERFPASAELEKLEQDAEVKQYRAIVEPALQAQIADIVFEQFARYVFINRIKLSVMSPLETGNPELLSKNPTNATQDEVEKFLDSHKSATLDRFLDLAEQALAASSASMRKDPVALAGPTAILKGMEVDLADLCIGRRS